MSLTISGTRSPVTGVMSSCRRAFRGGFLHPGNESDAVPALYCFCCAEPSCLKYTSTFMPTANEPGSARSTTTSTTLTSV
jgi:hypothetical protein